MAGFEGNIVTTADGLAALYAKPTERILKKDLDYVNAAGRAFIAASPFLVLATGSQQGLDCSPKGDKPGFVEVSDDGRTLLIPDRRGNNLIGGLRNLIEEAHWVDLLRARRERDLPCERTRADQHGRRPQATLRGQRQGTGNGNGRDGRTGISTLSEGAGQVQSVEREYTRATPRGADAGRLRGGAIPGNRQCRSRRSVQSTDSQRALLMQTNPLFAAAWELV
jgi:hypothetical protein